MKTREIMASKDYIHDPCVACKNETKTNTACFRCFQVSGSVMSIYSGDFGNLEIKGNIQFAVDYVDSLKNLHISSISTKYITLTTICNVFHQEPGAHFINRNAV